MFHFGANERQKANTNMSDDLEMIAELRVLAGDLVEDCINGSRTVAAVKLLTELDGDPGRTAIVVMHMSRMFLSYEDPNHYEFYAFQRVLSNMVRNKSEADKTVLPPIAFE